MRGARHAAAAVLLTAGLLSAAAVWAATSTARFTYDGAGRLTTVFLERGGTNAALHYQYDPAGNHLVARSYAANDAASDQDADGLGDLPELRYFADLDETGAGDPDGDRMDNATEFGFGSDPTRVNTDADPADDYGEYVTGTDPTNAASFFTIVGAGMPAAPGLLLAWPALPAREYRIDGRPGLTEGSWSNVLGPVQVAVAGVCTQQVAAGSNRYFRIDVRLAP